MWGLGRTRVYKDSTGNPIKVGDKVLWRAKFLHTIAGFRPGEGRHDWAAIDFEEELELEPDPENGRWPPDENNVDLVEAA